MDRHIPRDYATSNVLAWTTTTSANVEPSVEEEAGADADEPPDCRRLADSPISKQFKRAPIRRGSEQHESLLTKALQSHSDEDNFYSSSLRRTRRRSITSNFSLASTAELTCDTGITTPPRTNSPSPRLPGIVFAPIATKGSGVVTVPHSNAKAAAPLLKDSVQRPTDPAVQALQKKRCISFACAAKPRNDSNTTIVPLKPSNEEAKPQGPSKKTTIKFACASRPQVAAPPQQRLELLASTPVPRLPTTPVGGSPSSLQQPRSSSTVRSYRGSTPRRNTTSPVSTRSKKWLTANSKDLQSECAHFHEFASDELQEDDWIRRDDPSTKPKLTINDTLRKENAIRKLGKEAEEEAELEEETDEETDDENVDEDDEEDEDEDEDDCEGGSPDEENTSDGYNTDNEVGFADSEDEEDDGLILWSTRGVGQLSLSGATPVCRRPSMGEQSDSSACSKQNSRILRAKNRERPVLRPGTPDLPDSTDFVCGTLDEDRPLEEAYMSRVAARRRDKLLPIPQDIDPSFPTSEPEDEAEELYKKGYGQSDDNVWLHGELEDIHQERHERDRAGRKKKTDKHSPQRCRSPPPRRCRSPPPKGRGRSDRKLFDRTSPRRFRSPAPAQVTPTSPTTSPSQGGEGITFKALAFRPGLTHTKSLPRAGAMFAHLKTRKASANTITNENHIRGAIDIVKGLEQKRQRRKEKFYQKYCNRARKEKAQVKRPPPGRGAERMREVGLIMAGKIGQGNYVLSV
ncbi:hypothetical protein B0T17DRAFT_578977 [Bombardia bombarda]|uniref:Uncharacterized protein n=1 Tax=Bombardia bombarda TaxID=252184 RepID=A0AA39WTK4_9PEZI|nr:hypothetical protein B0T17DRAFT_578977 [Bombardia bombarda]